MESKTERGIADYSFSVKKKLYLKKPTNILVGKELLIRSKFGHFLSTKFSLCSLNRFISKS